MHFLNRTVARANGVGLRLCMAAALCMSAAAYGATSASANLSAATSKAAGLEASNTTAMPEHVTADDPVKVRDALAGQMPAAATQSLSDRIRNLAREPFDRIFHGHAATTENGQRTFLFMIPAPHGILYRSATHRLSVNVPLASDEHPEAIQLYLNIVGPRGRGLVIAPDAKAKGYIQNIDLIQLKTEGAAKTVARGRLMLSKEAFENAGDNFAILLVCTLEPPYLTETREHSDPTDEEPTDITRRTSTLHASVQAVWLVNQKDGSVLGKGLSLAK
ncbi:conserved exported hypothetical protein [Paraburkholderia piptadeniae]|uniref:Uncharacterized protein n=2 Tax=Paraburkholderia piptadeniae TaxID=1701573 RepID=A0A1N7SQX6_9BURK|nr:conserved exported hypothetical protein [Paraburkholderia piptadeniae]